MTVNNSILKVLQKNISIALSSRDDKNIDRFFQKILGKNNICGFDDTEYMHRPIHLVVCVNKVESLEKSMAMSHYLHVPLLIIDTQTRPDYIPKNKIFTPEFTYMQIATDHKIAESWGVEGYHDVLDFDIMNSKTIKEWKETLNKIGHQTFKTIKETENNNEQYSPHIQ